MENMETVNAIVEEVVATEEMKEAVIKTAEEIVAETSGNVLTKLGKAGAIVAGVAAVAYAGYKFVVKPIKEKKLAEELADEDVPEDFFEEDEVVEPNDSEESNSEEIEK